MGKKTESRSRETIGGMAGWVLARLRSTKRSTPRLSLVERIALGPHQSLALVEAEGRRLLVATSAEGGPAFYALEEGRSHAGRLSGHTPSRRLARVSW